MAREEKMHLLWAVGLLAICQSSAAWNVTIDLDKVLCETDDNLIGFAIDDVVFDPEHTESWTLQNLTIPKVLTLFRGLSPAVLRIGGSAADYLFFNRPVDKLRNAGLDKPPYSFSTSDWDTLVSISVKTNLRLLFCLDLSLRYNKQWNPSQAMELFEYSKMKGYGANLDWELGNEPSHFNFKGPGGISGSQLGDDYVSLRKILDSYEHLASSRLVGPDVVGVFGAAGVDMMKNVADKAGKGMAALTFHHYYFRGDTAKWQEYINPNHFGDLVNNIVHVRAAIKDTANPNMTLWIGETADAWHQGTPNVSDRYVSGFLWLDKLGVSAKMGLGVVIRQTFHGGSYGLVDSNLDPTPDYWLSFVHKTLVGKRVLSVELANYTIKPPLLRVYAHCTAHSGAYGGSGSVTLIALSMSNTTQSLSIPDPLAAQQVDVYLLTPDGADGLLSKFVAVNGHRLTLVDEHTLPDVTNLRQRQSASTPIHIPPYTFGFFVFPNAQAAACS